MGSLVSVIVPVFNSEKYLSECIESILGQSYCEIELLLIDDGSTDQSPSICIAYAEKDGRVRYIKKENGGVSSARNAGIDHAKGEFIFFCDSDDWLAENAVEILMCHMKPDIDMVVGQIENVFFDSEDAFVEAKRSSKEMCMTSKTWHGEDVGDIFVSACAKLYRTSVLLKHGIRFHEGQRLLEDMKFVFDHLIVSNGWVSINDAVYKYRCHVGLDYIQKRQSEDLDRDINATFSSVKKYFTNKQEIIPSNVKVFFFYQYNMIIKNEFWGEHLSNQKRKNILRLAEYVISEDLTEGVNKEALTRAEQCLFYKNNYLMYRLFNRLSLLKHGKKVKGNVAIKE